MCVVTAFVLTREVTNFRSILIKIYFGFEICSHNAFLLQSSLTVGRELEALRERWRFRTGEPGSIRSKVRAEYHGKFFHLRR